MRWRRVGVEIRLHALINNANKKWTRDILTGPVVGFLLLLGVVDGNMLVFRGPRVLVRISTRYKASGDCTAIHRLRANGFSHVGVCPFSMVEWLPPGLGAGTPWLGGNCYLHTQRAGTGIPVKIHS